MDGSHFVAEAAVVVEAVAGLGLLGAAGLGAVEFATRHCRPDVSLMLSDDAPELDEIERQLRDIVRQLERLKSDRRAA